MTDSSVTPSKTRFAGVTSGAEIPRYFLYGDDSAAGTWFVNVEPLEKRCRETQWYIAPHSHPHFTQIVLVKSGGGAMTADDRAFRFESPAALIVPVHVVHAFRYAKDTDGWVLTIAESHQRALARRAPEFAGVWSAPRCLSFAGSPAAFSLIREALIQLDKELDAGEAGAVIAAESWLSTILVMLLREIGADEAPQAQTPRGHGALVAQFKDLIERRYREGWPISRFADELNVSLPALRSACMSVAGETPIKMVHDRIMDEARRNLIYSEMSVAQIAYWLGFDDPSYFSRFFTRQSGERPAAYRQASRKA